MSKKLPHQLFLETFKYVPRTAVDILVKNKKKKIILTRRNLPPGKGLWHIPGSYIMKDERIQDCIERIIKGELGIELSGKNARLLGVFEDMIADPRGHTIDIIYEIEIEKDLEFKPTPEAQDVKFFKKLPPNIGFNHQEVLNSLGYF